MDTYFLYAQVVLLRVEWLRPMPYEVNVDEVARKVIEILVEDIDYSVKKFGRYETIIIGKLLNSTHLK